MVEAPESDLQYFLESRAVPVLAHLHLIEECNQTCEHCYRIGLPWGDYLSGAEWIRILEEAAAEGAMELTISGGEPLLHPEWRAIVGAGLKLQYRCDVIQNGTIISESDLDFLREGGVNSIHFSIHGVGASHDRFVGRLGSYDRAMKMVRLAVARGIKTVVKMSLLGRNMGDLAALADRVRETGAVFAPSYYMTPRFGPGNDDFLQDTLTPAMIRDCDERFRDLTGRAPFSECGENSEARICNMGWTRFAVGPRGEFYPCSQVTECVGNLRGASFREVWRHSRALNRIRRMKGNVIEACAGCAILDHCRFRCMGRFQQTTGRFDDPAPEHCEITAAWLGLDGPAGKECA